jgi:hypothetical protein
MSNLDEAKDPNTPKERLEKLYATSDERCKKLLALNPNAPLALLFNLANDGFANLVVQNPIWEILYLENPNVLQEHPPESLRFVKTFTFLTEKFFFFIRSHPNIEVVSWLASNPNCTAPKLDVLAQHESSQIRALVAGHARVSRETQRRLLYDENSAIRGLMAHKLPADELQILYRLGANEDLSAFKASRQDPNLSTDELLSYIELGPFAAYLVSQHPNAPSVEIFATNKDPFIRAGAATASSSIEILESLSTAPEETVRAAVAKNPRCPERLLEKLLTDLSPMVREAVASSTRNEKFLSQLAGDTADHVVIGVLSHEELPTSLLSQLVTHSSGHVRDKVAGHPRATKEMLSDLIYDQWCGFRHSVVHHPNRPRELITSLWGLGFSSDLSRFDIRMRDLKLAIEELEALSNKTDWLAVIVAEHPNCTAALADTLSQHPSDEVRSKIATYPNLTTECIVRLAGDNSEHVQAAVASHPRAPLAQLAQSKIEDVRAAVAQNPQCPIEMLQAFLLEDNPNILIAVTMNPNCPAEVLARVVAKPLFIKRQPMVWHSLTDRAKPGKNPNCPVDLLWRLAKEDIPPYSPRDIIENPNCPADILEFLSLSEEEHVRQRVAMHCNTAHETLQRLLSDPSEEVQQAVFQNPKTSVELFPTEITSSFYLNFWMANHANCPPALRAKILEIEGFLETLPKMTPLSRSLIAALPETEDLYLQYLKQRER